jgi:hypothetical protein
MDCKFSSNHGWKSKYFFATGQQEEDQPPRLLQTHFSKLLIPKQGTLGVLPLESLQLTREKGKANSVEPLR